MSVRFRWAAVVFAQILTFALADFAQARVVLIGIDGGSWNLIDPMLERGELPHLASLMARGVHAEMSTVEPVNSPTVWTSIATGRSPDAHGVTGFYRTRHAIEVPVLWQSLTDLGLRVGTYDYLLTWPPPELPGGFVIPGWLRRDLQTTPSDVFSRASISPYSYSSEALRTPDAIIANCRRESSEKAVRFVKLLEHYDPHVAAVTFYGLDAASHRFWHAAFPEQMSGDLPDSPPGHKDAIVETLRGLDAAVGVIVSALTPDDAVIIVSDHGFQADERGVRRKWITHLEPLLERSGLAARGVSVVTGWRKLVVDVVEEEGANPEAVLTELVALIESITAPGGDGVFDVNVARAKEPDEFVERWLLRARNWIEDLTQGKSLATPSSFATVYGSLNKETAASQWPDGDFDTALGSVASAELFHTADYSGTHHPTAIFVAGGGPFREGGQRGRVSVLDVAPLIRYLSGQPVPRPLEGKVPLAFLDPEYVRGHPVQFTADDPTQPPSAEAAESRMDDDVLTERLRSLGYVE